MKYSLVYIVALIGLSCSSLWAQTAPAPDTRSEGLPEAPKGSVTSIDTTDVIYTLVDEAPVFEKGNCKYYMMENYIVTEKMLLQGKPGKMIVSFVVEKDGSVSNVKVTHGLSLYQDAEVIRVIKSTSGMWTPGKVDNMNVRCRTSQEMYFNPDNFE